MTKTGATPLGRGSRNLKGTPQAKASTKATVNAKATVKAKAHETSLAKPPTPKTPGRTLGSMAMTMPAEEIGLGRTRRKRGGTHMERDGSSGFISSSVMTMFMFGPVVQPHWLQAPAVPTMLTCSFVCPESATGSVFMPRLNIYAKQDLLMAMDPIGLGSWISCKQCDP